MFNRDILDSIQTARLQNKQLKFPKISIFHEATQQKLAIKKFISNEENLTVGKFLFLFIPSSNHQYIKFIKLLFKI